MQFDSRRDYVRPLIAFHIAGFLVWGAAVCCMIVYDFENRMHWRVFLRAAVLVLLLPLVIHSSVHAIWTIRTSYGAMNMDDTTFGLLLGWVLGDALMVVVMPDQLLSVLLVSGMLGKLYVFLIISRHIRHIMPK